MLFSELLYPLSCFIMQTIMKNIRILPRKSRKPNKEFLVASTGSTQGQGCDFSAKWKNKRKTGLKSRKPVKIGVIYTLFGKFTVPYVTITPNKSLKYTISNC